MERVKSKVEELVGEWWKPITIVMLTAILLFFNAAADRRQEARLQAVATETHSALCALESNMHDRFQATQEYLKKHEGKEPIPGISRADLRRSLQAQRATLKALDTLNCRQELT